LGDEQAVEATPVVAVDGGDVDVVNAVDLHVDEAGHDRAVGGREHGLDGGDEPVVDDHLRRPDDAFWRHDLRCLDACCGGHPAGAYPALREGVRVAWSLWRRRRPRARLGKPSSPRPSTASRPMATTARRSTTSLFRWAFAGRRCSITS